MTSRKYSPIFWATFTTLALLITTAPEALAQVRDNITDANPFEEFICPIIGLIRSYGLLSVILGVILLGLLWALFKDSSDSKGTLEILKSVGATVVGVALILFLYFTFEGQIIEWFGITVCPASIQ